MKEKILVSACLIGEKCRYDGKDNLVKTVLDLAKYYDLVPICPEVSGGLKTPRQPAEIINGKVLTQKGRDVTEFYENGAYWAYSICQLKGIKIAILKENSPSCGVKMIHDGSFTDKKIEGKGITARKLAKIGVRLLDEQDAVELLAKCKESDKTKC